MLDASPAPVPADGDLDEASPQEARRARILDAARACFAESGFHGASMQRICAEARMSPGALYRYFPSKHVIVEAIAEDERARCLDVLDLVHGDGPLVDRLVAGALAYLELMRRPGSCALMLEICAESLRNSAVGDLFGRNEAVVRAELAAVVAAGIEAGEVAPDVDVARTLQVMFAVTDGLVLRTGLEPDLTVEAVEPHLRRIAAALLPAPSRPEPT